MCIHAESQGRRNEDMHRKKQLEDGDEVPEGLCEDFTCREEGLPAGGRGRAGVTKARIGRRYGLCVRLISYEVDLQREGQLI